MYYSAGNPEMTDQFVADIGFTSFVLERVKKNGFLHELKALKICRHDIHERSKNKISSLIHII